MAAYEIDYSAWAAGVAAVAALIAAIFSFHSSQMANRIAKQNLSMTAELEVIKFREQWLQSLRQAMIAFATTSGRNRREAMFKITLLLNSDEKDYDYLNYIGKLVDIGGEEASVLAERDFIIASQAILKIEWEKIKASLEIYKVKYNAKNQ